jgi:hypothetical protein
MYKQKLITKDLKDYLIPKVTQPGKVQGKELLYDDSIVIRPSDTTSDIVVLNLGY